MNDSDLIEAINDLARVTIACNDKITNKSEAVRRLNQVAMRPSRIAALLGMPPKDVTSQIAKMKKSVKRNGNKDNRRAG